MKNVTLDLIEKQLKENSIDYIITDNILKIKDFNFIIYKDKFVGVINDKLKNIKFDKFISIILEELNNIKQREVLQFIDTILERIKKEFNCDIKRTKNTLILTFNEFKIRTNFKTIDIHTNINSDFKKVERVIELLKFK